MQTILDVTLAGGPFAVGYHSPTLHWYFVDSDPGVEVDTQVRPDTLTATATALYSSCLVDILCFCH